MDPRETFKLVYKVVMILATVGLAAGTVAAWLYSTTGNGLLLVAGILALLTLIAGLSISKLDDQDRQAKQLASIVDDVRSNVKLSYSYAEPEVHHVDNAMVERAKAMAAGGASIDDICRMMDPGHEQHDPAHREAFRRVVKAMLAQG